jgi:bacterioferritin (cytochrome b1)
MGFDLERSDARRSSAFEDIERTPLDPSGFKQALSRNLLAERFAIDAYRKIAEHGKNYDKATLRLVKVALAVEEEHAEILASIMENLRNLNGALAG